MFHLEKDSIILIYCPAKIKTGGTELLHQLADELHDHYECYMVYDGSGKNKDPKPEAFSMYRTRTANYVPQKWDAEKNLLIVPETRTGLVNKFKHIQKAIWWLSVDNYINAKKSINEKNHQLLNINKDYFSFGPGQNKITHLVQSHYAWLYLRKHGIRNIGYLSDYINTIFIDSTDQNKARENIVLYNPKKGKEFTQKIIAYDKSIQYIPICNMDNGQIVELMKRSKVYIDFGEHPGKDRLPREAALCGLCIITGKRGAAGNAYDITIPAEFKFSDKERQIPKIINKIHLCLDQYEAEVPKMSQYVSKIRREKNMFHKHIAKIFNLNNKKSRAEE